MAETTGILGGRGHDVSVKRNNPQRKAALLARPLERSITNYESPITNHQFFPTLPSSCGLSGSGPWTGPAGRVGPPGSPRGLRALGGLARGGLGGLPFLLRLRLLFAHRFDPAAAGPPRAVRQRLLARRLLLRFEAVVHELEDGRLRAVSPACAQSEDARVAA